MKILGNHIKALLTSYAPYLFQKLSLTISFYFFKKLNPKFVMINKKQQNHVFLVST